MAQTGYTPISIYYSSTASATPTAGNLVAGELAINTADGKLYYKDSSGVVQTIASKDVNSGTFTNISVSGVASFADGTVSLPSITNIGDTNTGIYFPAADTIAFTEGGAESMRIDSSGNVLIGTATAQELLTVNKNAAFGTTADAFSELRFFNSTSTAGTTRVRATAGDLAFLTSNAERMRVDGNGNVAIGTSTAYSKFCITTTNGNFGITGGNTSGGNKIQSFGATTASDGYLAFEGNSAEWMRLTATGNLAIGTTSTTGLITLGRAGGGQYIGALDNTTGYEIGYVQFNSDNMTLNPQGGSGGTTGFFRFNTSNVERMRIRANGVVCIGTTDQQISGSELVTIRGVTTVLSTVNDSTMYIATTRTGTNTYINFGVNGGASSTGSVTTNGTITIYNTTSDYRLKNVIGGVVDAGKRIDALEPIEYDFKSGGRTRGFLAHQFAEVYPDSVSGEKDAIDKDGKPVYQAMQASSSEVMADLIAEIQSLRKRIAQLESK